MIDPHFSPNDAEPRIYKTWEEDGCFKPSMDTSAEAYAIVIPPPNVTGVLHMGHALNNTLQDVLCRYQRMRGKNVLWQPGTDHAGIATQMVVERQLAEEGNQDRRSMERDAFVERVWQWKEQSGGQIINQLKRLGASCDWSRERFTLDEGLSKAVRKVFVQMYNEGLIYRDKRLVNWDPQFQSAISDLEVDNREVDGHFWHFKYPLADGETYTYVEKDEDGNVVLEEERDYISIATTRPETMLGDGAVAVHPDDERYAPIVGKMVRLPLADRLIPIITDEHPDPAKGSGAVKITGAHDFDDYGVAKRHDLPMYPLMDEQARMIQSPDKDGQPVMPEKYVGMDRFEARKAVIADIDAIGLLLEVEDKKVAQPFGDRSGVVIEPMLTDQWYVDAKTLAKPAIEAVESGKTRFVPENWAKTYFEWMRNIEPWCISRQLWWGHRIPAWYGPDGEIFVGETEEEAKALAEEQLGAGVALMQDEDVLDTWFSSGLWPFSTMGWPDETPELKAFYPTATLVTAFDIIFFWVARMMMQGIHFMGEVPFKDVYIHALVRDETGAKMSKSKGNVIDPLELVDTYGADALRFTLTAMAAQGRDIKLSKSRVEGYRNFGTKLWNAARFCQMNECTLWEPGAFDPAGLKQPLNRWIVSETVKTSRAVASAIEEYRFNEAADAAYRFIWNVFCDWYLELIKPLLNGEDEAAKGETRQTAAWALDEILKLLHPMMPFLTEELWQRLAEFGPDRTTHLMVSDWPDYPDAFIDEAASAEVDWVVSLITETRSVRSDLNVPAGAKIPMSVIGADAETGRRIDTYRPLIERLARVERIYQEDTLPEGAVQFVLGEATIALSLAGSIDIGAEIARLTKEIGKLDKDIEKTAKKLDNPQFLAKAPEEVIAEQKERLDEARVTRAKLTGAKDTLEAL